MVWTVMCSQYAFVGVPLHTARIACWFSRATTHWSNFCTRDSIDSQTILRTIRQSKIKFYSVRALKCYLNEKDLIYDGKTATISKFSPQVFETYFSKDQTIWFQLMKKSWHLGKIYLSVFNRFLQMIPQNPSYGFFYPTRYSLSDLRVQQCFSKLVHIFWNNL